MRNLTWRRVRGGVWGLVEFVGNVAYYLRCGHYPCNAINLARDTLPTRKG